MLNNTIRAIVKRKVEQLSNASPSNKAILAKLRRGVGKQAGSVPEIWEFTLGGLPDELVGKGTEPSYGEVALHTALTLYALHTQGSKQANIFGGGSIGLAAAKLKALKPNNADGIKRRFDVLATAKTFSAINQHARGLIQLLKQENIAFDYARFASDLFELQFDQTRKQVMLRWGRDFVAQDYKIGKEKND
jgi:CRISPR system Cascade subunit CasB